MKTIKDLKKIAMNIVYQLDDDAKLNIEFRQQNNDKRIDFVFSLIHTAIQTAFEETRVEKKVKENKEFEDSNDLKTAWYYKGQKVGRILALTEIAQRQEEFLGKEEK